jgi:hypothetical protein
MFDYSRKPVKWQVGNFRNLTCAACNCCVTLYKSGAKVSLWGAKNQNSPFSFSEKGLFYRDKSRNQG